MGKWVHKLTDIDIDTRKATCSNCGLVTIKPKGKTRTGYSGWRCKVAWRVQANKSQRPWLQHRKNTCERCGFIPEHISQLDVDHIDGDKANNHPDNLHTLCANCHRLKTFNNKDSYNKFTKK